ncbi:hypothetical protein CTI14_00410 [Methylobacterium radiotolerans]|nr:hypothetical protein CTI14_00410 [Methylobacterium radiotolerans]
MAFFNDLVRVIASVEGMEEMTVRGICLSVRDAGHVSKGGRGLSAAKMSVRDAANLLIGVNASSIARSAGSIVQSYRDLQLTDRVHLRDDESGRIFKAPALREDLGSYLEFLIDTYGNPGSIGDRILSDEAQSELHQLSVEIAFSKPEPYAEATYRLRDTNKNYAVFWFMGTGNFSSADRRDTTTISDKTLRAVAEVLFS